jgi:uncharacterized protein
VQEIPFRFDPEACDGCGECARACERGAIELSGKSMTVDAGLCDGCEDCVLACPTTALSVAPPRPWTVAEQAPGAAGISAAPVSGHVAAETPAAPRAVSSSAFADTPAVRAPGPPPTPVPAGTHRWRLVDLFIAGAVLLVLQLGTRAIAGGLRMRLDKAPIVFVATLVFYALLVALVEGLARLRGVGQVQLGFAPFKPGRSVAAVIGLMVLLLISREAYVQLARAIGFVPPSVEKQLVGLFGNGLLGLALAVGVTVILAPIVEELFFRGFVYGVLRERMAPVAAMMVSALIFAIYHFSLWLIVPIVLLGIALAWLREWQRSIWPAVMCHALNNLLAVLVVYWPTIQAASRAVAGGR